MLRLFSAYKYMYNGKEWQDELTVNFFDYGFRNYDPALGRWLSVDPLAEKFESQSPYNYVSNDPIGFADLDGQDYIMTLKYDSKGQLAGVEISGTVYIQGSGASSERAEELNEYAKSNIKSSEGVTVSINFVYNNSKKVNELKSGENIVTFASQPENKQNISHVNWNKFSNKEFRNRWLTGNTATVYDSGKNNFTVVHEVLHLFGLADRYDDYRGNKTYDFKGSIPFAGFKDNFMANFSLKPSLHKIQYQQWFDHAKSRAKVHNNTLTRIVGKMAVDQTGDFIVMPDGSSKSQIK